MGGEGWGPNRSLMVVALAALSAQGGVGFWEVFLWPQLWFAIPGADSPL